MKGVFLFVSDAYFRLCYAKIFPAGLGITIGPRRVRTSPQMLEYDLPIILKKRRRLSARHSKYGIIPIFHKQIYQFFLCRARPVAAKMPLITNLRLRLNIDLHLWLWVVVAWDECGWLRQRWRRGWLQITDNVCAIKKEKFSVFFSWKFKHPLCTRQCIHHISY